MKRRALFLGAIVAGLLAGAACRSPESELSSEIRDELERLKKEKDKIEQKIHELRIASAALQKASSEADDALETIQNALAKVRASLEAIEKVPLTTPVKPKRLSIYVSLVLVAIMVFCVLMALKLRSVRLREMREGQSEEPTVEKPIVEEPPESVES